MISKIDMDKLEINGRAILKAYDELEDEDNSIEHYVPTKYILTNGDAKKIVKNNKLDIHLIDTGIGAFYAKDNEYILTFLKDIIEFEDVSDDNDYVSLRMGVLLKVSSSLILLIQKRIDEKTTK